MAKKQAAAAGVVVAAEPKYTKKQILASRRYAGRRDLLSALLVEGEAYTHSQVEKAVEDFNKKRRP